MPNFHVLLAAYMRAHQAGETDVVNALVGATEAIGQGDDELTAEFINHALELNPEILLTETFLCEVGLAPKGALD